MDFEYIVNGKTINVRIEKKDNSIYNVIIDNEIIEVDSIPIDQNSVSFKINDKSYIGYSAFSGENIYVSINGEQFTFKDASKIEKKLSLEEESSTYQIINSPMPGLIVKLGVKEGDIVEKSQICVIVEAMKMEHELRAKFKGKIVKIYIKEKAQVTGGQPLVEIEAISE